MTLNKKALVLLALMLPVVAGAQTKKVLTQGWYLLTDEESQALGFKATFTYESPDSDEGLLLITVPEKVQGSAIDEIEARLFNRLLFITSYSVTARENEQGDMQVRLRLSPRIVTRVRLRLTYSINNKYELNIDLKDL